MRGSERANVAGLVCRQTSSALLAVDYKFAQSWYSVDKVRECVSRWFPFPRRWWVVETRVGWCCWCSFCFWFWWTSREEGQPREHHLQARTTYIITDHPQLFHATPTLDERRHMSIAAAENAGWVLIYQVASNVVTGYSKFGNQNWLNYGFLTSLTFRARILRCFATSKKNRPIDFFPFSQNFVILSFNFNHNEDFKIENQN